MEKDEEPRSSSWLFERFPKLSIITHILRVADRTFTSYRFAILGYVAATGFVLLINLVFTLWAVIRSGVHQNVGTIYTGQCSRVTSYTFWMHLVINILGILLTSASNYSMQCLSSPTRAQIDTAHKEGTWLYVGVPNWGNLHRLSRLKLVLWTLLAFSTIPLLLVYNNAVFSNLSTRNYSAFAVSSSYLNSANMNASSTDSDVLDFQDVLELYRQDQNNFKNMTNHECIRTYTASTISRYSDVLLVSSTENSTHPFLEWSVLSSSLLSPNRGTGSMNSWICTNATCNSEPCTDSICSNDPYDTTYLDRSSVTWNATSWSVDDRRIEFCLAKKMPELCKLQFSLPIMIIVIACNFTKFFCMLTTLWKRDPQPLITLGDAVSSFLERPDATTAGTLTPGKVMIEHKGPWRDTSLGSWKAIRWFQGASFARWAICMSL